MRTLGLLVLLGGCSGGSTNGSGASDPRTATCDVSTDPAATAVYERLTGEHVAGNEAFCVDRASTFVGWVQFGWYEDDLGCRYDAAIYDCVRVSIGGGSAASKVMADAGWADADAARRTELLVAFFTEIVHTQVVTDDAGGEFARYEQTFTPPSFDGSSITLWDTDGGGMTGEATITKRTYVVNPDGTLGEATSEGSFTTGYPPDSDDDEL